MSPRTTRSLTGTITRFTLPQGLHSFEIEVVPGAAVVNPNFSVRIFATDNSLVSDDLKAPLRNEINKLTKKIKKAIRSGQKTKAKKLKTRLKKLKGILATLP